MVDPNIKKKADDILAATYGGEVQETLASGLVEMSEDVVENTERQDEIESQFQDVLDETTNKDFSSAPEIRAARNGKPNLKRRIDDLENETTAQLAHIGSIQFQALPLAPMTGAKVESGYTGPMPLTFKYGYLWGVENNSDFVKSSDNGKTWQKLGTKPSGTVVKLLWTNDGEVLATTVTHIYKSRGWSDEAGASNWEIIQTKSPGVGFVPWSIDGDGTKFIATEYSGSDRSESRYVWVSTNMGETFEVVLDKYEIDPDNRSHMHGVAYDKWADRFFLSHGHDEIKGVYWSEDDGRTWHRVKESFNLSGAAPTTLTATDNGIVCGSDSREAGLYGIPRTEDPHDMRMIQTARWDVSRDGVAGFAYEGIRDEETGQVYVSFKSDHSDVPTTIMTGTATTGSTIWKSQEPSSSSFEYFAVTDKKVIGVYSAGGTQHKVEGDKPTFAVPNFDSGNILGGKSETPTSTAIGWGTIVTAADTVAIGNKIFAEKPGRSVLIGVGASADGNNNVVIGYGAKSTSGSSIALGVDAEVLGLEALAIGRESKALSTHSTAIGRNSEAGERAFALGAYSKATHRYSVALGNHVETTNNRQVKIGQSHLAMDVTSEFRDPATNETRLMVRKNAEGKLELCAVMRGDGGATGSGTKTTILATSQ